MKSTNNKEDFSKNLEEFDNLLVSISESIENNKFISAKKKYSKANHMYLSLINLGIDHNVKSKMYYELLVVYEKIQSIEQSKNGSYYTDLQVSLKKSITFFAHNSVYLIFLIILLSFSSYFFFFKANITGFVVHEGSYYSNLSESYSESASIFLHLEGRPNGMKLNGNVIGDGSFSVKLFDNGTLYTIVDSTYFDSDNLRIDLENLGNDEKEIENETLIDEFDNSSVVVSLGETIVELGIENISEEIEERNNDTANNENSSFSEEVPFISEEPISKIVRNLSLACMDTCLFSTTSPNVTVLIEVSKDVVLNLSQIVYDLPYEIVVNAPPTMIKNFSTINIIKDQNYTINLSEYFVDYEEDSLTYFVSSLDNISFVKKKGIITFYPHPGFIGYNNAIFSAYDGKDTTNSGLVKLKVIERSEETIQGIAKIGIPVLWTKKVDISNVSIKDNISILIPDIAFNIGVTEVDDFKRKRNISDDEITVDDSGVIKELPDYESEKQVEVLQKEIDFLKDRKNELLNDNMVSDNLEKYQEYYDQIKIKEMQKSGLDNMIFDKNGITGRVIGGINSKNKGVITKFFNFIFSNSPTGNVVSNIALDFAPFSVSVDKPSFEVGDVVYITISPANADYSMYVFQEEDTYQLDNPIFVPTKQGLHTINAIITSGKNTERVSTTFLVTDSSGRNVVPSVAENISVLTNITDATLVEFNFSTGYNISANNSLLIISDVSTRTEEIEIQFETEAPQAIEYAETDYKKTIVITSDIHYLNVLAYTYIPNSPKDTIHLFHIINESRINVENITYFDEDNDTLIDMIEWITPHLSNQTYELEIVVLNVQSYPMVGGNWTVFFNTTGVANLTISAINLTTYTESFIDSPSTYNDLLPVLFKCGEEIIFNYYNLTYVNSLNLSAFYVLQNDSIILVNDTLIINNSLAIKSMFFPDYSCNTTSYWTANVLTKGVHDQMFMFGNFIAYAHNFANNPPITDIIVFSDGNSVKTKTFLS